MAKYYERNPNSPFFHLMQDTSVEDKLSEEEKERIVWITKTNLISVDLETEKSTPDEEAYLLYVALNDVPADEATRNLLINELGKEEVEALGL
ncbi:hypothetical protein [Aggregatibacter actinomycetemcomitans]|uniref:hypothetical protein n=1 Tax=Aggregatibacter actinomycetemcomitans TaxID=714 RepID=UPI0004376415|nr:hypothetical protein [Aggregatibacter actinomycetemcomitans]AHN72938.1 hypothetical protein CF65_02920 [Aggregatibacter actinomycetemcomitans HK1651]MBN6059360.1 hypothetical protein [Aggregatibacter actinomycetemcomitans]MBN6087861.1 hypothetical protein [Aggregatibacter actinomycetemcomitans]QPQ81621.1 hypothetical protein I6H05_04830 [Aggregatibacter actinomycetemcomitans]TYA87498.1 hypothetical protein FXE09_08460 [Aggregatibacter actinomycetemcomitans]